MTKMGKRRISMKDKSSMITMRPIPVKKQTNTKTKHTLTMTVLTDTLGISNCNLLYSPSVLLV